MPLSPIYDTVANDDILRLTLLLKDENYIIDIADLNRALSLAVRKNNEIAIDLLLKEGADINYQDPYRNDSTPLILACSKKNETLAIRLINLRADIHIGDRNGVYPLMYAATNGLEDTVALLCKKGADVNLGGTVATALYRATMKRHIGVVKILVKYGSHVDRLRHSTASPLMIACTNADTEIILLFIENGADLHLRDRHGLTALFHVVAQGNENERIKIVDLLVANGADITYKNPIDGKTMYDLCIAEQLFDLAAHVGKLMNLKEENPI